MIDLRKPYSFSTEKSNNSSGELRCKEIINLKWPNLMNLNLSKQIITLVSNKIKGKGCSYLALAQWPNLEIINLGIKLTNAEDNKIGDEGCIYLKKAQWPKLR